MAKPKDIGKAFKERLKDFDSSPSTLSWGDIESKLPKKEKNRFPYWVKISGVLVLLLLLTFSANEILKNSTNKENDNTTTNALFIEEDCPEIIENKNIVTQTSDVVLTNSTTKANTLTTPNNLILDTLSKNHKKSSPYKNNNQFSYKKTGQSRTEKSKNKNSYKTSSGIKTKTPTTANNEDSNIRASKSDSNIQNKTDKIELLPNTSNRQIKNAEEKAEDKNIEVSTSGKDQLITGQAKKDTLIYMRQSKKQDFQKFSLGINIIPTYAISPKGSLINDRLPDSINNGRVNFDYRRRIGLNYGLQFKTYFSKKLALRVGYNRLKIGNKTKDLFIPQLPAYIRNQWSLQTSDQIIENESQVDLVQKLVYNELSLGLQYEISDKKITSSLVGGFNFTLLGKNDIVIQASAADFTIKGEDNIEKIGLGFHLGSNLKYKISDNLFINVDPLINYQFGDASKNLRSHNLIYFTIQAGISFEF